MRIDSIEIHNFRGFDNRQYEFDPRMNVVVGNNTAGKTTILHSVQIALGAYLQCLTFLPKERSFRRNFVATDRVMDYVEAKDDFFVNDANNPFVQARVQIPLRGTVHGVELNQVQDITWYREAKGNTTIHSRKNVGELMSLVDQMVKLRMSKEADTNVVLPLVLAFGADRIDNNYKLVKKTKARESRVAKAYKCALSETVDFKSALDWIYRYNSTARNTKEFEGTDRAFFQALETAARLKDISVDTRNRELWATVQVTDLPPRRLKYEMMSDGFKSMINIVSEMAYRCIELNGHLGEEAVRSTPGIVLIDEVDLFLHPHWQQHVLADLQEAFPQIQFIVTSHSPFIIQSVESNANLITLDGAKGEGNPMMRSIEDIAVTEMNMETDRFPKYKLMVDKAEEYYNLVVSGEENSPEGVSVKKQLDEIEANFSFDPAYVALLRAERKSAEIEQKSTPLDCQTK